MRRNHNSCSLNFLVIALCILEFCPEHISKTILARVMKFHGWIDLIEGGVQYEGIITLACLIFELLPFVVFHT